MSTNSFLITFAGYPTALNCLLPDNGLASLAGALIDNGHTTRILDYGKVSMIREMFPPKFSRRLRDIGKRMIDQLEQGKKPGTKDIISLLLTEKLLERYHRKIFSKVAREISNLVEKEKVDFIGFKLWNGYGFAGSLRIAHELKKAFPEIPIFAGGPHVDLFKETILKATGDFDAIAYGEGEETIVMLAEHVEGKRKLKDIPNLIFTKDGRTVTTPIKRIENLDDLPFPVYDEEVYPAMGGDEKIRMIMLDESRGCNNSCYFCPHPMKSGKFRTKSSGRTVEEIERIINKYGIKLFKYAGSNTPITQLRKIAEEIMRRNLKIEYTTFSHVKGARLEHFKVLKESGCYAVFFGIESGSQGVLDESMNKGVRVEEIRNAIRFSKEAGLFTVGSLIFPSPIETEASKRETLDLLLQIKPDSVPIQIPMVCPGTEWEKRPEAFGFELDKTTYVKEVMTYKVKLLSPPRFWKPLPYKINGKDFRDYVGEYEQFAKALEKEGLLTVLTDEMALLAKYAGVTPRELRDLNRLQFLTGDYETIKKLVEKINKNTLFNS